MVVAANRDEFHARPAAPAAWWADAPAILAGRDLEARGTWMGVSRTGRFAAVTNYRGAREPRARESRGALVTAALGGPSPADLVAQIEPHAAQYSGFNLLASDGEELWSLSNRGGGARRLEPGVYALGNTLLDAPEVGEAKAAFEKALAAPAIESLLGTLAPWRIVNDVYGTRCSTVLRVDGKQATYVERPYLPDGSAGETRRYRF
ncbi:MAG TPA: NRDE family protein [Burkholderiales bacterium]|nr:NRDE family protein [Burkholderiales bacterium]